MKRCILNPKHRTKGSNHGEPLRSGHHEVQQKDLRLYIEEQRESVDYQPISAISASESLPVGTVFIYPQWWTATVRPERWQVAANDPTVAIKGVRKPNRIRMSVGVSEQPREGATVTSTQR